MDKSEKFPSFFTVILNYNNEDFTDECLASLREIQYPNHNIIVIDDCSNTDKILAVVKRHPGVIFRRNPKNINYCKSFNRGIKIALSEGAEYVFLVNNDTKKFSKNYINSVIKRFDEDRNLGIVGTKCYDFDGNILRDERGSVRFGFNMVVPSEGFVLSRGALEQVGGFNEKLLIYMEDLDLLKRLAKNGFTYGFCPDVAFSHYCGGVSSAFKFKFTYLRTRNICLFARYYLRDDSYQYRLREIVSNSGSPIKLALNDLAKGHYMNGFKRISAVVSGLAVGFLMDPQNVFEER